MISYNSGWGFFWFRIFGYGFSVENREIHPELFSERMKIKKVLRLGKYAVKLLGKPKLY